MTDEELKDKVQQTRLMIEGDAVKRVVANRTPEDTSGQHMLAIWKLFLKQFPDFERYEKGWT